MNTKPTDNMKRTIRKLGRKVRGGSATQDEEAAFDRIDNALAYIAHRKNRERAAPAAWYDLPAFKWAWEGDARHLGA